MELRLLVAVPTTGEREVEERALRASGELTLELDRLQMQPTSSCEENTMVDALIIDACRTPRGIGKAGKGALAGLADAPRRPACIDNQRVNHGAFLA